MTDKQNAAIQDAVRVLNDHNLIHRIDSIRLWRKNAGDDTVRLEVILQGDRMLPSPICARIVSLLNPVQIHFCNSEVWNNDRSEFITWLHNSSVNLNRILATRFHTKLGKEHN